MLYLHGAKILHFQMLMESADGSAGAHFGSCPPAQLLGV